MTRATTREPVGDGTEPWHGRASGYNHHKCGCDACRGWMQRTKAAQGLTPEERAAIRARRAS